MRIHRVWRDLRLQLPPEEVVQQRSRVANRSRQQTLGVVSIDRLIECRALAVTVRVFEDSYGGEAVTRVAVKVLPEVLPNYVGAIAQGNGVICRRNAGRGRSPWIGEAPQEVAFRENPILAEEVGIRVFGQTHQRLNCRLRVRAVVAVSIEQARDWDRR